MPAPAVPPDPLAPSPRRILCVAAHPDDNEFTIAGSVARWTRDGAEVVFCLVTSGEAGLNLAVPAGSDLITIRERESWEAARILGVKDVVFLRYPDGTVEPTLALRRDLARVIRWSLPDVVVTCTDPGVRWYRDEYLNHPDHRAVASATLDAVFPSAETRTIFPELLDEGLEPHRVREVFIADPQEANVWVDIGPTFDAKCAALRAHVSQVGAGEWVADVLRGWAEREGARAGVVYAEAFRRLVLSR